MSKELEAALEKANLVDELDEDERAKLARQVVDGFEADAMSREQWEKQVEKWTKLAMQVAETKSFPWSNAANVKFPLLSTAAIQFSARAYPSLVPGNGRIVGARTVGFDPEGKKTIIAKLVAKDMSAQLQFQMEDWEDEFDKLLITEAIIGCAFKKTYFDPLTQKINSCFVHPLDIYVDYYSESLEKADRVTQVYTMSKNNLQEYVNAELFDVPEDGLPDPKEVHRVGSRQLVHGNRDAGTSDDSIIPYLILEQHGWYDLDEDGYAEPYIFYVDYANNHLLRMVARWDSKGVKQDPEGKVIRIEPIQYFTKFSFIKSPDSGFYDVGFGLLLGSLNASADTLLNQLLDAGTLRNLQAGFVGKGLRLGAGRMALAPGEWREVNVTGQNIKDNIFPLPLGEPSEVLFKLLGMIVEAGNKLASVAEIFTGKMPGQNTPATTTMETVEQGMKLFTAIYKRNFRALEKEFKKIFRLNEIYRTDEEIQTVLDLPDEAVQLMEGGVKQFMYSFDGYDICPGADANIATQSQRLAKVERLLKMLPLGINKEEALKRVLDADEHENIQALLQKEETPPPIEVLEFQLEQEKFQYQKERDQINDLVENVLKIAKAVSEKAKAKQAATPEMPEAPEQDDGADLDRLINQITEMEARMEKDKDREHDMKKHELSEETKRLIAAGNWRSQAKQATMASETAKNAADAKLKEQKASNANRSTGRGN